MPLSQKAKVDTSSTPSISSAALLVQLSIGQWNTLRKDTRASRELTKDKNASHGSAKVDKDLMTGSRTKQNITELSTAIRKWHREATMPWSNFGLRLLPNETYFDYHQQATEFQREFRGLVSMFMADYKADITRAQIRLGDLFDPMDYPNENEVHGKFRLDISYQPIAEAGDFRVDMGNEAKNALSEQYEKFYSEQLEGALADVWERLSTPLHRMSNMLDYAEHEKPKGFKDTLVSNVETMAGILKTCNITNDPAMEEVRQQLMRALRGVTPDALRESEALRSTTKDNIDKIIGNIPLGLDM